MSIGSGEGSKTSTKQAYEALQVFSRIQPRDKLRYHKTTGVFEIDRDGNNFSRTFDNLFRKKGTENSVTNEEMFHRPIVNVFNLTRHSGQKDAMESALNGLRNLEKTYETDQRKLEALHRTLADVRKIIDESLKMSAESLLNLSHELSRRADLLFNDYVRQDIELLSSAVIQQMSLTDQAAMRVIFGAVRNDRTRMGKALKEIGNSLDFFSNNHDQNLDLGRISDRIYEILQKVNEADIQNNPASKYREWITQIRSAAHAKNFTTVFQGCRNVNVHSDTSSHPSHGFLWFSRLPAIDISKVARLYFCPVDMCHIDQFIRAAGDLLNPAEINFKFKIDYEKNMVFQRRDAVVLYYEGDLEAGRRLAGKFRQSLGPVYFKQNFGPFGATSVSDNNDIFWQAEPGHFDTGLNEAERSPVFQNDIRLSRQHSATSIRAELITMALLRWKIEFDYQVFKCIEGNLEELSLTNNIVFEDEFERFQRYVAGAFHGYQHLLSPASKA